jgi:hypothetical protein
MFMVFFSLLLIINRPISKGLTIQITTLLAFKLGGLRIPRLAIHVPLQLYTCKTPKPVQKPRIQYIFLEVTQLLLFLAHMDIKLKESGTLDTWTDSSCSVNSGPILM